jgi:4-amino-4-deoxy-L-arabinose transferase-like glycosyltransferase
MLRLQQFFGGDAITYHDNARLLIRWWQEGLDWGSFRYVLEPALGQNGGMIYYVGGLYWLTGPNMLAVQYVNSVVGAATAPVIFLCAMLIFRNTRVARLSAYFVAFYPSLVLWSSQGLKDGPIVFLLALVMLATLKLGERWNSTYLAVIVGGLFGLISLRFYVFYMAASAVAGAFLIGMRPQAVKTLPRQLVLIACVGLALTYLGVLRTASSQLDTFADLNRLGAVGLRQGR